MVDTMRQTSAPNDWDLKVAPAEKYFAPTGNAQQ
jgi:hypothetical protein